MSAAVNIRDIAEQILYLHEENDALRAENIRLTHQLQMMTQDLVESNRASGQQLVGWIEGILNNKITVTPYEVRS